MDDFLSFTRARLDEDKQVALGAMEPGYFYADGHTSNVLTFLERWNPDDPRQVLAEIESKLQMLDLHTPAVPLNPSYGCPTCWEGAEDGGPMRVPCPTLRLIAVAYAGHPNYQQEWRPSPTG